MAARPKWPTSDIPRVGRGALQLATEHRSAVEQRLAAGVIDGLSTDLDAFDGKRSEAARAPEELRTATRTQDAAARTAMDFVSAARFAVTRNGANAAQRTAFGLKLKPKMEKISSIVAALDSIIDGATRFPTVARSSGLVAADLDSARALRAALVAADAAQETQKEKRKSPTAERKALQQRIEHAVDAIIAAGQLAFVGKPEIAARFRALIPGSGRGPAPQPPAPK